MKTGQWLHAPGLLSSMVAGRESNPDTGIFSPLLYQLSYPAGCMLACKLVYYSRLTILVNT